MAQQTLSVPSGGLLFPNTTVQPTKRGTLFCISSGTCTFTDWFGVPHSLTGGGGTGGGVSSVGAGNLIPLFTTTMQNATTTPVIIFNLTNAPANTIFGNFGGSIGPPSYNVMTACGDSSHALSWVSGTGFVCQAITTTAGAGGLSGQLQYNNAGALGGVINGSAGQVLTSNGVGVLPSFQTPTAGGNPVGANGQVQYNNNNAFGGISNGSAGQILTSNGAGTAPSFQTGAGGPIGATGQVQYNNSGTFGGISNGTTGQVLTSNGAGNAPSFQTGTGTGSSAFGAITTGVNTTATMAIGSGAIMTTSGSGVNNANQTNGGAYPASVVVLGTNASSQPVNNSSQFSTAIVGTAGFLHQDTSSPPVFDIVAAVGTKCYPYQGTGGRGCDLPSTGPGGPGQAWRTVPIGLLTGGTNGGMDGCALAWNMKKGVTIFTGYDWTGTPTQSSRCGAQAVVGSQMSRFVSIPDNYTANTPITIRVAWIHPFANDTSKTDTWGFQIVCQDPTSPSAVPQPTLGTLVNSAATNVNAVAGQFSYVDTVINPITCSPLNEMDLRIQLTSSTVLTDTNCLLGTSCPVVTYVAWKDQWP